MAVVEIEVDCPVFDSFRVEQVAGMFDVALAERAKEHFRIGIPDDLLESVQEVAGRGEDDSFQPSAAW
ncbi:MAG: hypothetical protein ACWGMZ_03490, partial [Thermoguttaceae bacterium]